MLREPTLPDFSGMVPNTVWRERVTPFETQSPSRRAPEWRTLLSLMLAKRGATDRTAALEQALLNADADFERLFGFPHKHKVCVCSMPSKQDACLQACDYFLWALQRFYEMDESRFTELVWNQVGEINDLGKEEGARRGILYGPTRPLVIRREPGA